MKWLGTVAVALEVPVDRLVSKSPPHRIDKRFIVRGAAKQESLVPLYALEEVARTKKPEVAGYAAVRSPHTDAGKLFVAKVRGKAMEPTIPANAHCLFRWGASSKVEGKVVLAALPEGTKDAELKTPYTVRRLKKQSAKALTLAPDGKGAPLNGEARIIAELVEVLEEVKR